MRNYVKRLLESRYEVEAVRDRLPDLVLTDVMMPGLDGVELLRSLRANPDTHKIPIILLSARAGEESRIEGLEAGAVGSRFDQEYQRALAEQVSIEI